ncbi:MAG: cytochrome P450 [Alphaproteobacteria bacterium]|nr:cytochrome P450 [Alphaproteobacteria bacterium]
MVLPQNGIASVPAVVTYDPRLPSEIADPFPTFARLRAADPVHWSEVLGGWVLTRYEDCRALLNDRRLSADRISPFRDHLKPDARARIVDLLRTLGLWAVFTDPPLHTRLRGLMNKAFTPRAIERLRPAIQHLVDVLIDRFDGANDIDLIRDFAYPLPATVIATLIGVPVLELDRLKRWSDDLAAFVGNALATPDKRDRAQRAVVEMSAYFRELAAAHRREPQDDVMSGLIAASEAGDRLSEDDLIATCILLLFAGHETTTNLIGNGMLALLRHPDQMARLRAEPSQIDSAIEEMLRWDGPTMAMTRIALTGLTCGGKEIKTGDRLYLMLNAANRDPAEFDDPESFDVARADNRHISFGYGIHYCVGAPLARLEGQIGIATLLSRLPTMALAIDTLDWSDSFVLRGVRALPLRVTHAAAKVA